MLMQYIQKNVEHFDIKNWQLLKLLSEKVLNKHTT